MLQIMSARLNNVFIFFLSSPGKNLVPEPARQGEAAEGSRVGKTAHGHATAAARRVRAESRQRLRVHSGVFQRGILHGTPAPSVFPVGASVLCRCRGSVRVTTTTPFLVRQPFP